MQPRACFSVVSPTIWDPPPGEALLEGTGVGSSQSGAGAQHWVCWDREHAAPAAPSWESGLWAGSTGQVHRLTPALPLTAVWPGARHFPSVGLSFSSARSEGLC